MVRLETIKNKTGLGQSEGLCKIVVLLLVHWKVTVGSANISCVLPP